MENIDSVDEIDNDSENTELIENLIKEIILNFSTSFNKRSVAIKVRDKLKEKDIEMKIEDIEQKVFNQLCLLENDGEVYLLNNVYRRKGINIL